MSAETIKKDEKKTGSRSWLEASYEWLSALVGALVAVALVFTFLFRVVSVSGDSMTNTFQDGDRLITVSCLYSLRRGDVVVIGRAGDSPLIKRVVALAGDTVELDDETGLVRLNGEVLDEPFVRGGFTPSFGFETPYIVPEGCVFAMGDNRPDSADSRLMGAFPVADIAGVAMVRLWPTVEWVRQAEYKGE